MRSRLELRHRQHKTGTEAIMQRRTSVKEKREESGCRKHGPTERRGQGGEGDRQNAEVEGNAANQSFNPDCICCSGASEKPMDYLDSQFLYLSHGPILHAGEGYP